MQYIYYIFESEIKNDEFIDRVLYYIVLYTTSIPYSYYKYIYIYVRLNVLAIRNISEILYYKILWVRFKCKYRDGPRLTGGRGIV